MKMKKEYEWNVHYPDKEKIHQKMLDSIDYFKKSFRTI